MTPGEARALTLGQRVRFRRTLRRYFRPSAPRSRKVWEASPLWPYELSRAQVLEGIVVGRRSLRNGEIEQGWYEEPTTFHPTESVLAVLVAWRIDRKPVLVAPADLEHMPTTVRREDLEAAQPQIVDVIQEDLFG